MLACRLGIIAALAWIAGPTTLLSSAPDRVELSIAEIARRASTRLLVVAPHPDDEVLAAAGLIRRVVASGGAVRVVYLTNGEGYAAGVAAEEREPDPKPKDYREYGRQRQAEARAALAVLGVAGDAAVFLGFPDGGLCNLLTTDYWSDRRPPYESPYSRRDRPRASQRVRKNVRYRGEDLVDELAKIVDVFRPTTIVVPRPEDQHPDHCAASFLVDDTVASVRRTRAFPVDVINYIVHYNDWPSASTATRLPAPPGLGEGTSGWMVLPLDAGDRAAKRDALARYRTQMNMQRAFLTAFLRSNEIFSRPVPARVKLPMRRAPCCKN